MPTARARSLIPYLLASILALAAIGLRVLLEAVLGHNAPLMVFVLAVVVASIAGGLGPGLVVTAICSVAMVIELEPHGAPGLEKAADQLRVVLFLVIGAVSATLGERRLRLERTARIEAARAGAALARESAARAEAERLGRLRDEFLATVSHELRTPLNAIVGWAELLTQAPEPPEKTARGLEIIRRNARAQAELIEDLLDASRLVTGKLQLDVTRVRLDDVARDAIETVRHAASARQIRVVTELDVVTVCGDARRLHQIVWNLLTNAVKFGRVDGEIRVRVAREEDDAVVEVTDDGRGIDPAFLPHVFEKFRQEDASTTRSSGGLGLGLALSRSLVELHGGSIRAESSGLNAGCTFTVRVPRALEHAPELARIEREQAASAAQLEGMAILVVDDDSDSLETAAAILEQAGARVVRARSGDEALAQVAARAVGVVLLDLMMPERDGFEVIRELRERGTRAPVIALTSLAFPADRTRTHEAGFAAHITKPIESAALIDAIARSMSRPSGAPASA